MCIPILVLVSFI